MDFRENFEMIIEPIKDHDRPLLRKIAEDLKQKDGESWAVGEMLERACILLDAIYINGGGE